jgi:hypothetical protein
MKPLLRTSAILIGLLVLCAACSAQTDPKNVPQPPAAELKKFDPFLGKYEVSGDYAHLPWNGTLELKKVIKGWYIEQIIMVKTEGIDREFRILATWDRNVRKYRLWGFQTLPIMPDNGGEIRFAGEEMITEWVSARQDGSQVAFSNRYRFVSNDELEILSYRQVGKDPSEQIGLLKGTRMLNTEEMVASTPKHPPPNSPQPAPEMRSLARAFEGKWAITEKLEPDEWSPSGGMGSGEEVWRSGPGGFTFMEEVHDRTPSAETFAVGFTWWDKTKGFQGIWCINTNPKGCVFNGALKWDGKQLVYDTEFPRGDKKFAWHEVFSDITPTSFTQTADIGESGGPLKRWLTIHATRSAEGTLQPSDTVAADAELRDMMDKCRKASLEGDVETVADCLADEYHQTDISGYVQDKTGWLNEYFKPLAELIKAGKFRWEMYHRKDMQFRIYGDCAVVIGALELKGSGARPTPQHSWVADPNATFSVTLRFTYVYVKRNGKWLLAALHNQLPVPPPTATESPLGLQSPKR